MKLSTLLVSIFALSSQLALAGGGGGCQIPALLKDKTMTCKGSFISSTGFFATPKSFSTEIVFDDDITYDNSNADVTYTLYKVSRSGYENLYVATGCDDTEGSRVTKYGAQYIGLGDSQVFFQLGKGKNDTGILNVKSELGSAQVRCILK